MAEIGQVIEKRENNRLLIRLERQEACAKCRACTAGMQSKDMLLEAENLCNASVGDNVEISLEETDFMKAVLIMYGIPFIAFVAGVLIGYYFLSSMGMANSEVISFIIGIVLVIVSYLVIHRFEPRFKSDNYVPKATALAESKEIV